MKLPSRLENLLKQDNSLNATVLRAMTVIEPWARDNRTVFFSEYTDHSLVHLNEVLASADSLISDASWAHLTPEDAAVVVLSVLLHDSALHLTEEGFYTLIEGRYQGKPSRYSGVETPWPQLWNQYFARARRFDQRKLESLFGDTEPVQEIPSRKLDLTLKHRLLIGEFLRLHHARLAHEMALSGIPGIGAPVQIGDGAHSELLDLAGYVARSHNLKIRTAIDALEGSKRRVHLNCRVPFAMVVLRIADYLQVHSARAPGQLLRLKNLSSPISRGEWQKHGAVKEINQAHEDPEALFVDCEPDSAFAFLGMQNLLSDIQSELDHCWAALGEVYGRFGPLDALGITIRRIRSNIDDPEQYRVTRRPAYLPREFKFQTSSADLLDLLVTPLYGAKPVVGVRELVQNAVDACLERDDLLAKRILKVPDNPSNDVVVTLVSTEGCVPYVVVEDFGVGMTPDIVEQYFLKVGASFRSSDLWRKNHEVDGHSTIHRTGRFGIGLLAAFLLGKEVRVTTRHMSQQDTDGITFLCKQGAETIEVRPCSFHAGTRIEVQLTPSVAKALGSRHQDWDWYCLSRPRVKRAIFAEVERTLDQRITAPECGADIDAALWSRINVDGYDDVLWSYELFKHESYVQAGPLICNGIYVTSNAYGIAPNISPGLDLLKAKVPTLVVFDPDGRFPINLQRDKLAGDSLSVRNALSADVSRYFARQIAQAFEAVESGMKREVVSLAVNPGIDGLQGQDYTGPRPAGLLLTATGIVPADLDLLFELKPPCILFDAVNMAGSRGAFTCPQIASAGVPYLAVDGITNTKSSRTAFLKDSLGLSDYAGRRGFFQSVKVSGRRIFVRKADQKELVTPGNVPKTQWSRLRTEYDGKEYAVWSIGSVSEHRFDWSAIDEFLSGSSSLGFAILYFDWDGSLPTGGSVKTPFGEAWRQQVGGVLLPYR